MTPPAEPRTPPAILAVLALLIAWGLFPFRVILDHYPWKIDALKWVTEGATSNPDWPRWVFATTHFVGYRPVAAGSFTIDHAIGGWGPEIYRITDFGLHALVAVAAALVFRRLAGRPTWWMLLPALIVLGHPAVEEALPYLARRSYLLASMFSTFGLALFLDHLRQDRSLDWRAFAATALLALGILSNEAAYVVFPMLPLFALHARWTAGAPIGPVLARCLLPWSTVIPAVTARFVVLGWTGGYEKHYFAFTRMGRKALRQVDSFNGGEITAAALEYLWLPVSMGGADTVLVRSTTLVAVLAAGAFWMLVVEPLLDRRDAGRRTAGLLTVWLVGYALLYALSRTWFWRQGYPMLVPLGLSVAWIGWDATKRYADRPLPLIARLAWVALVLLGLGWHSPMVRGMSQAGLSGRFEGNALVHEAERALEAVPGPGTVYTVLPLNRANTRNAHAWLGRITEDRDLRFVALAHGSPAEGLVRREGHRLLLGEQATIGDAAKRALRIEGRVVDLTRVRRAAQPTWILFPDDGGVWTVIPVDPAARP